MLLIYSLHLLLVAVIQVICILSHLFAWSRTCRSSGIISTYLTFQEGGIDVFGKRLIWFSQFLFSMSIKTILVIFEFTFAFLNPKSTQVSFVIVVRDIHHFHHQFRWERIVTVPLLGLAMSKMTAITFSTVASICMMFTKFGLEKDR